MLSNRFKMQNMSISLNNVKKIRKKLLQNVNFNFFQIFILNINKMLGILFIGIKQQ